MESISLNVRKADACQYLLTIWEMDPGIFDSPNKHLLRVFCVPCIRPGMVIYQ